MYQPVKLNRKIKTLEELKLVVKNLKKQKKRTVFTNGCFDIVHAGHVKVFQEARGLGDVLIVAINSDSSVRALKGSTRPVVPHEQRREVIAALESVDYVIVFDELDPLSVIEELMPDVLVKGGDWNVDNIVGREVVERAGGSVRSIPLMDGVSTTDIINRIRESCSE
jgi:rfaE bifunctional protein nucleotidyltransferase chain/domain